MSEFTIMPATTLEQITAMLSAASWCKTQEMELVLAQAVEKHINPPILFNGSNVAVTPDE